MPKELRNLRVAAVSLVDRGANQKQIVWKRSGDQQANVTLNIKLTKFDEEKRIVEGIVYAPEDVDSHGHYATAKTIELAAHQFMQDRRTDAVDLQHDGIKQDAYIAESWIVQKGDARFGEWPGAWAVAIKILNDTTWNAIKSGEIGGLSLAGFADVEKEDNPNRPNAFKRFLDWIKKSFESNLVVEDVTSGLYRLAWILEHTIHEIANNAPADMTEQVNTAIDQFISHIQDLKLTKAGAVLSANNLEKLTAALESIQQVIATATKTTNKTAQEAEMTKEEVSQIAAEAATKAAEAVLAKQQNIQPPAKTEQSAPTIGELQKQVAAFAGQIEELQKTMSESKAAAPDTTINVNKSADFGNIL